jgi:2-haloacid dehalogenase
MVQALIFDVFGTVVDWRSGVAREVAAAVSSHDVALDPAAFADAWRARYDPAMAAIREGRCGYCPLDQLHRENLELTLREFGLDDLLNEPDRAQLNRAWEKLPPWPDACAGLTTLKEHYIIAPCSNGSIALMTRLAKYGGLPWDAILGAEIAKAYKPDPKVYLAAAEALALAPGEVMMVAAHNSDLAAARAQGLKTAFLPRPEEHGPGQTDDLAPGGSWDVVARDLEDLAAIMTA